MLPFYCRNIYKMNNTPVFMVKRKLSQESKYNIVTAYNHGISQKTLAEDFNVSPETIVATLCKYRKGGRYVVSRYEFRPNEKIEFNEKLIEYFNSDEKTKEDLKKEMLPQIETFSQTVVPCDKLFQPVLESEISNLLENKRYNPDYEKIFYGKIMAKDEEIRKKVKFLSSSYFDLMIKKEPGISISEFEKLYAENFNFALRKLGQRDQKVYELRHKKKMILEKTGKKLGISRERVRQIEKRVFGRLKWLMYKLMPSAEGKYKEDMERKLHDNIVEGKYGEATFSLYSKIAKIENNLAELNNQLEGRIKKCFVEYMSSKERIQDEKRLEFLIQPIEILGLHTRPYNALTKSNIKNISDLLRLTEEDLRGIRLLGQRSINNIKAKLTEHDLGLKKF